MQRPTAAQEVPAPGFTGLTWHMSEPPGTGNRATAPQQATATEAAGSTATSDSREPPRVLVVGGSIGGCCAALALGELGCQVSLFERAPGDLKTQGAGLVIQPDMADFLLHYKVVADLEDICVQSSGRQYVDGSGRVVGGDDNPQLFSAWDVLHRSIKARVPPHVYHSGTAVSSISSTSNTSSSISADRSSTAGASSSTAGASSSTAGASSSTAGASSGTGSISVTLEGGEQHSGDLLVGCDGPGSIVRRHFLPEVRSEYQGYVAWRGFACESDLPQHVLDFMQNNFTVYQMPCSHILAYVIPGADGATQPGRRRINWVWYCNTPEEELGQLFLDTQGRSHLFSVPRGLLRPEVAAERKRLARELLAPPLADLVQHTSEVFAQAIHDLLAPRLALSDNCCLLGDAGCILRPHTAAGTTKAAVNAMALAASLQRHHFDLPAALHDYEHSQLQLAEYLVGVGRRIGTQSQFPEGVQEGRG